jgi:hypothetical protein
MSSRDEESQVSELDRTAPVAEARRSQVGGARDSNDDLAESSGYEDSDEGVDAPSDA